MHLVTRSSLAILGGLAFAGASAQAATYQQVYSFAGGKGGDSPNGSLIQVGGSLYGVTYDGGSTNCTDGCGIVFALSLKTGRVTTVYSFQGGVDGEGPSGALLDVNGTLYGTTSMGGQPGSGIVFALDPNTGTETVVYTFKGGLDATNPNGGLIDIGGTLYGTSSRGGPKNHGTVYSVNPSTGAEKVLHSFSKYLMGWDPIANLLQVGSKLYSTTTSGGTLSAGTIFEINPKSGATKSEYSFQGGLNGDSDDGAGPASGLIDLAGTLYGTTLERGNGVCPETVGCGTIYTFNPATATETVVYSFQGNNDGSTPIDNLLNVGGTLYGVTENGGTGTACDNEFGGCGTVYSFNPAKGGEKVLYSFQGGSDGALPYNTLVSVGGTLYGVTTAGGTANAGTIYSITP